MKFEIAPKSTEIQANWGGARMYCFSLKVDGKVGWRLPTKDELNEIYQSENDYELDWYWSSTERNDNLSWYQDFYNGAQYSFGKGYTKGYIRAIRSIS